VKKTDLVVGEAYALGTLNHVRYFGRLMSAEPHKTKLRSGQGAYGKIVGFEPGVRVGQYSKFSSMEYGYLVLSAGLFHTDEKTLAKLAKIDLAKVKRVPGEQTVGGLKVEVKLFPAARILRPAREHLDNEQRSREAHAEYQARETERKHAYEATVVQIRELIKKHSSQPIPTIRYNDSEETVRFRADELLAVLRDIVGGE
jgi:hypothetical protein